MALFVALKKITHLDFQSNLKKKKKVNAKLEKLLFSQNFPTLILNQFFLYISVHFVFPTSNACQWMSANVSAAKRHFVISNIQFD